MCQHVKTASQYRYYIMPKLCLCVFMFVFLPNQTYGPNKIWYLDNCCLGLYYKLTTFQTNIVFSGKKYI